MLSIRGSLADQIGFNAIDNCPLELTICQQPVQAYVPTQKPNKKYGPKPVDPPVIIRLSQKPQHRKWDPLYEISPHYHMQCSLVGESNEIVKDCLTGTLVSSSYTVPMDGEMAPIFAFGDIRVMKEGMFRLRFTLLGVRGFGSNGCLNPLISIDTDPFICYNSKYFSKLEDSTPLTRHLVEHGVRLKIRRGRKQPFRSQRNEDHGVYGAMHTETSGSGQQLMAQTSITTQTNLFTSQYTNGFGWLSSDQPWGFYPNLPVQNTEKEEESGQNQGSYFPQSFSNGDPRSEGPDGYGIMPYGSR